jgi:hypothetical protein
MNLFNRLTCLFLTAATVSACSVKLVTSGEGRVTTNQCKVDSDCGASANCSAGACFAKSGSIDDVLFEMIPDAQLTGGPLSYLSPQSNVSHGDRSVDITLQPVSFNTTIHVDNTNLPSDCATPPSFEAIEGTVEFSQANVIGGFSTYGLSTVPMTFSVVEHSSSGGNAFAQTTVSPGTYDIYIQPKSPASCPLAPRMIRGVEVSSNPLSSTAPVTLNLPAPLELRGTVARQSNLSSETLAGWHVDLIEPQDGRVISTTSGWPPGTPLYRSNFSIDYQPVAAIDGSSSPNGDLASNSLILRILPPDSMVARAPTVYWALSAIDWDGDGAVSLDLSGIPTSDELVAVSGTVRTASGDPVPSTIQFLSKTLDGTMGLTASFTQSTSTDANGAFKTALFPGDYRIVAAASQSATGTGATARADSPWAITTDDVTIRAGSTQSVDVALSAKRVLQGKALIAGTSTPALGAIVQALPAVLPDRVGVWRGALAQTPIVPAGANVAVSQLDGSFVLSVDPGMFDLSVSPSDSSNFASWVWPHAQVAAPSSNSDTLVVTPRLSFPVAVEGNLDDGSQPLPNAVIRAYAKVAGGSGVTKVGDTRTDAAGHYVLLLPPSFGP